MNVSNTNGAPTSFFFDQARPWSQDHHRSGVALVFVLISVRRSMPLLPRRAEQMSSWRMPSRSWALQQEQVCDYVSEQVLPHAINGEHICDPALPALRCEAQRRYSFLSHAACHPRHFGIRPNWQWHHGRALPKGFVFLPAATSLLQPR